MGEMADWLIEQGMAADAAHDNGECDFGCPRCAEEEAAEKKAKQKRRKASRAQEGK